jgi:hypothetical protein
MIIIVVGTLAGSFKDVVRVRLCADPGSLADYAAVVDQHGLLTAAKSDHRDQRSGQGSRSHCAVELPPKADRLRGMNLRRDQLPSLPTVNITMPTLGLTCFGGAKFGSMVKAVAADQWRG